MSGNVIRRFISFFTVVIITRYLGPEQYGHYTFVISILAILSVFWNFGLGTLIVRDVARDSSKTKIYTGSIITINSILLVIAVCGLALFLTAFHYSEQIVVSALIFGFSSLFGTTTGTISAIFAAYKKMDVPAFLGVIGAVLLLIFIYYTTKESGGIVDIFLCYFLSSFFVFLISSIFFIKYFSLPVFTLDIYFLTGLMKKGLPFFMISAVNIILFRIDQVMLSKMVKSSELGMYGSAYTLFEVVLAFFPMLIMSSSFPVLSGLYKSDTKAMSNLYNSLLKYFLLFGVPISIGTMLLGHEIIITIYGSEYAEAGNILIILGSGIWVFFLSLLMSWTLTAMDKQRMVFIANFIAMILNVILNIFAIKMYGAYGAAGTTVLCEVCQVAIYIPLLLKITNIQNVITTSVKILLSSMAMTTFILLIIKYGFQINNFIGLFGIVIGSAIIYLGLSAIIKIFDKAEIKTLLKY